VPNPVTKINDELHIAEWLKTVLSAIPNLNAIAPAGAWLDMIPEEATLPGIRFHKQAGHDVGGHTQASRRIVSQYDWVVAGVVKGPDLLDLIPIADAIDYALDGASGTTATIAIYQCWRLQTFSLTESGRSGVQFRHAGGIYRTIARPL
jgi:hypothetical protein